MSLFDCKIARTKVEIISLLGSRRGFIQFPVRIKVVEGGIGFADPLSGGVKQNGCPFADAHFHFCFPLSDRASSTVRSKQKCPALGAGTSILFAEREGFEPYRFPHLFSMFWARL